MQTLKSLALSLSVASITLITGTTWMPEPALASGNTNHAPQDSVRLAQEQQSSGALDRVIQSLSAVQLQEGPGPRRTQIAWWTNEAQLKQQILGQWAPLEDADRAALLSFKNDNRRANSAQFIERAERAEDEARQRLTGFSSAMDRLRQALTANEQRDALEALALLALNIDSSRRFQPVDASLLRRDPGLSDIRPPIRSVEQWNTWIDPADNRSANAQPINIEELPQDADLEETEDIQFSADIDQRLSEIGSEPQAIYQWVHDTIDYLPTYGSIQGSRGTLDNRQGNPMDTASLLMALLRSAEIPARYAYGTVDIPAVQAINWLKVTTVEQAGELLLKGGIPTTALAAGGVIYALRLEHVWVEAWVDYQPSRGEINLEGDSWIPMDASFKQYQVVEPLDLSSNPFDGAGLVSALEASGSPGDFGSITGMNLNLTQQALYDYAGELSEQFAQDNPNPNVTLFMRQYLIVADQAPYLSPRLPYAVDVQTAVYSALPDNLRYSVDIELFASPRDVQLDSPQFSYRASLPAIGSDGIYIDYGAVSDADQQLLDAYAESESYPAYQLRLIPRLHIGSETVAQSSPVAAGQIQYWRANIRDPQGRYPRSEAFSWAAGSKVMLSIDGAGMSPNLLEKETESIDFSQPIPIEQTLRLAGQQYWMLHNFNDAMAASAWQGRLVRLPSVGSFSAPLSVNYFFGIPRSASHRGFQTDIKSLALSAVTTDPSNLGKMISQSGATGSFLEAQTWTLLLGQSQRTTAISAVSLIAQANQNGIPIYTITADNLADVLPLLSLSSDAKQEISRAINAGFQAIVPEQELQQGSWSGAGYILQDPETGVALYRIEGGLNGSILVGCIGKAILLDALCRTRIGRIINTLIGIATGTATFSDIFITAAITVGAVLFPVAAAVFGTITFMVAVISTTLQLAMAIAQNDLSSFSEELAELGAGAFQIACSSISSCGIKGAGAAFRNRSGGRGNPIDLTNGEKYLFEYDYQAEGPYPLVFTRYYRSFSLDGSLQGNRWRHSYQRSIRIRDNDNPLAPIEALVNRPDGSFIQYKRAADGSYRPPPIWVDTLTKTISGWEYLNELDELEIYNQEGQLLSITNRAGLTQTLSYNNAGDLIRITDPFNRSLTLSYSGVLKRLSQVSEPSNNTINYDYDAFGNLTRVTYQDATTRQYHYEDIARKSLLTGLTDERSIRIGTYRYDYQGMAISTRGPDGDDHYQFVYSDNNTQVTDPLGHVRDYAIITRFEQRLISSVSAPCSSCGAGGYSAISHDARGFIRTVTDQRGTLTRYEFNDRGLEESRTEAEGTAQERTFTTQWHPDWRVPTEITEPTSQGTRITRYTHDDRGNVLTETQIVEDEFRTTTRTYNNNGQVLTEDGPRTDVTDLTTYVYDVIGQLDNETNAAGHVMTYDDYNSRYQVGQMTDQNQLITDYQYDDRGRQTQLSEANETTEITYDPTGNLERITLPDNSYLNYDYNPASRHIQTTDNLGNRINYTPDPMGNLTEESTYTPDNQRVEHYRQIFNSLGRLEQAIGAEDQTTTYLYDDNYNETSQTDPLLHNHTRDYDPLDRITQITDPDLNTIDYSYDDQDNLTTVTDPRGLVTTYNYNGFNEQEQLTSPDTGITQYGYDLGGNLISRTDSRTENAEYQYDELNRLETIIYSDETITLNYDEANGGPGATGRLTSISDGSGSTSYQLDQHGRVTQKVQALNDNNPNHIKTTQHNYNDQGQLQQTTTPSGVQIGYSYGADGRVLTLTVNGQTIVSEIEYFPFGEPKQWTYGNNQTYQRTFDLDGRVSSYASGGNTQLLGYDTDSRITTQSDGSTQNWTYNYDSLERLNHADDTISNDVRDWDYDPTGNRTQEINNGITQSYISDPNSNKLTQLGDEQRNYDNAGNLETNGSRTWLYSGRNRLIEVQDGAITTAIYRYNGWGERVSKLVGSDQTLFTYDEQGHLTGEYDQNGELIQETVWLDGAPVATIRPDAETHNGTVAGTVKVFYIHPDHLDTPRTVVDQEGVSLWSWMSDPFGVASTDNDVDGDASEFTFNLRFPGQYYDGETGTHYNYFRDYEPGTGRYTQSDPIGLEGGVNTFGYAEFDPALSYDPIGLKRSKSKDRDKARQKRKECKANKRKAKLKNKKSNSDNSCDQGCAETKQKNKKVKSQIETQKKPNKRKCRSKVGKTILNIAFYLMCAKVGEDPMKPKHKSSIQPPVITQPKE